jgi:hypothetical protein
VRAFPTGAGAWAAVGGTLVAVGGGGAGGFVAVGGGGGVRVGVGTGGKVAVGGRAVGGAAVAVGTTGVGVAIGRVAVALGSAVGTGVATTSGVDGLVGGTVVLVATRVGLTVGAAGSEPVVGGTTSWGVALPPHPATTTMTQRAMSNLEACRRANRRSIGAFLEERLNKPIGVRVNRTRGEVARSPLRR